MASGHPVVTPGASPGQRHHPPLSRAGPRYGHRGLASQRTQLKGTVTMTSQSNTSSNALISIMEGSVVVPANLIIDLLVDGEVAGQITLEGTNTAADKEALSNGSITMPNSRFYEASVDVPLSNTADVALTRLSFACNGDAFKQGEVHLSQKRMRWGKLTGGNPTVTHSLTKDIAQTGSVPFQFQAIATAVDRTVDGETISVVNLWCKAFKRPTAVGRKREQRGSITGSVTL